MATELLTGMSDAAVALCKALGLDSLRTRSVRFELEAGEIATVTVVAYVTVPQSVEFGRVLRRYELQLREEEPLEEQ